MQTRHRSRNNSQQSRTNYTKSLMKGSVQTKQQSTCRNSPKPLRNKLKSSKNYEKKNSIKQINKLNYLMEKLTNKLHQFDDNSVNISVKSSIQTKQTSNQNKMNELLFCNNQIKVSQTTDMICEQMSMLKNAISIHNEKISKQKQKQVIEQQQQIKYENVFNKALAKPNCLNKMKIKCRMKHADIISQKAISLEQQINYFKKQQNDNWSYLNKQLLDYLNDTEGHTVSEKKKIIIKQLQNQGRANLRWIQIIQKMSSSDFQQFSNFNEKAILKRTKVQNIHQIEEICQNDQPLGSQLFLQNYKWDKYIWNDQNISQESAMQQNDEVNLQQEFNLSSSELFEQCDQIQQNVQIITEFLLNQFVVQLANKLDLNSRLKLKKSHKNDNQQYQNLNEDYVHFLKRINQIADDCLQIDWIGQNDNKQISPIIAQALIETIQTNPSLSSAQSKQKLKDAICKREFEISELIKLDQQQEYEWMRLTAMAELQEAVFDGVIMQEVCKLWMR